MSNMDEIDKMIEEEISEVERKVDLDSEIDNKLENELETEMETEIENEIESESGNKPDSEQEIQLEGENNEQVEANEQAETNEQVEAKEDDGLEIEWIECEDSAKKRKQKMQKLTYTIARYAVMAIALCIFAYAAYELTLIYVESKEATVNAETTKEMFIVDADSLEDDYEAPTANNGEPIELVNQGDGKLFVFDFEKMLEYNSDSKGYIRQDNGEYIDNPILQSKDNDYYLTHLANHKKSSVGAIFIDYRITDGLNAKNCIIYGHNMGTRVDNIMFGSLNWYYNKTGYYKEHPTFDIWIENTRYRYYVYAIFKTDAVGSDTFTYEFESDEAFMAYVNNCKKQSKYQFKEAPEITKDSNIVTLVTCTSAEEKRMIVQLVRGEELDVYGNPVGQENASEEKKEEKK